MKKLILLSLVLNTFSVLATEKKELNWQEKHEICFAGHDELVQQAKSESLLPQLKENNLETEEEQKSCQKNTDCGQTFYSEEGGAFGGNLVIANKKTIEIYESFKKSELFLQAKEELKKGRQAAMKLGFSCTNLLPMGLPGPGIKKIVCKKENLISKKQCTPIYYNRF